MRESGADVVDITAAGGATTGGTAIGSATTAAVVRGAGVITGAGEDQVSGDTPDSS